MRIACLDFSPFSLLPGADMNSLFRPLELIPFGRATVVVEQHDVEVVRELLHIQGQLGLFSLQTHPAAAFRLSSETTSPHVQLRDGVLPEARKVQRSMLYASSYLLNSCIDIGFLSIPCR